jgi:arylsulfatase A-like enzyme
MKRSLIILSGLLIALSAKGGVAKQPERPNIILILTDDQSYGMMGCTGNEIIQTPHLDQLASEGVLFTNAHVSSAICTPSRVSILLGQSLCYEKTTHVPMLIYNPMQKTGFRSDALVQTIDIAPTILSLAGVDIPEAIQGKDIAAFAKGHQPKVRDYLYTENLWSTIFGNPLASQTLL